MNKPTIYEGVSKLEARLKQRDRVFTIGDAAAITGYTLDEAKGILDQLMEKYDCRLKVTENGDLIYDFGSNLHPRGERTWAEWWHGFKKTLWKIFVVVFKVWISVMLVVYFVIFLVLLIAMIFAMMSGDNDNDSSSSSGDASGLFEFVGELFRSIFIWNTMTPRTYYDRDAQGYPYQRYETPYSPFEKINRRKKKKKKKSKNFVASVYDFVFGPPRVEPNALDNEKEVAAYVRKNSGVIVIPEVVALAGWTASQAQDFFTQVLIRYKGESKISENRVLYGDFYDLARQKTDSSDAEIVWYWNEYVPEYQLTGNSKGRNIGVGFMNAFNLVFSLGVVGFIMEEGIETIEAGWLILILLGFVPVVFSALFFLVPILRWFQILPKRRKRHRENIRKRLMKAIYDSPNAQIALDELLASVNSSERGEEKLDKNQVESIMNELIRDLEGEISLQDDTRVMYTFHQLREELLEARSLRQQRDSGKDLGNIVFDSHD